MCKRDLIIGLLIGTSALFLAGKAVAIERVTWVGARESGLSQAMAAVPGPFSVFNNQAFLTENTIPIVAISYRQPYFIPGYHECALSVVYPTNAAVFALGITQSSIDAYKESTIGISIAKKLTARLSAGVLFNYFTLNFPESGSRKGCSIFDGGVSYKCSESLSVGLIVKNMVWSRIETFQYNLSFPLVIRGGASLYLTERILLATEGLFEQGFGTGIHLGTEVKLTENFTVRGGISTNPFQHSFGFGYEWRICQLDFAMVHHELLGYSPVISFSFRL